MLRKRMAPAFSDSDTGSASRPLLSVRALTVYYRVSGTDHLLAPALADVNMEIFPGDCVGVFGESGCGKSTLLLSLTRLLPEDAVTAGWVSFEGRNLLAESDRNLQKVRGAQIGTVLQEAGTALNPVRRVGEQVAEVVRAHSAMSAHECREKARLSLREVGLGEERIYRSWPHQLSGGQRQRVLIAQALICNPKLIVADEPTHALDPDTGREITSLFQAVCADAKRALLIASHDPAVLMRLTKHLIVLYAGQVIESGRTEEVLYNPQHPYTRALVECFQVEPKQIGERPTPLRAIAGAAPASNQGTDGCRFARRCTHRIPLCSERQPGLRTTIGDREVRCFLYGNQAAS